MLLSPFRFRVPRCLLAGVLPDMTVADLSKPRCSRPRRRLGSSFDSGEQCPRLWTQISVFAQALLNQVPQLRWPALELCRSRFEMLLSEVFRLRTGKRQLASKKFISE